jgi:hypothetical protein
VTVVCLETDVEKDYAHFLGEFIEETIADNNPESIATIRSFWDNDYSWEDIQEKAAVEGSTWYVWWMDGVRKYMEKELAAMSEEKEPVNNCKRCGLQKTTRLTEMLDSPGGFCAAATRDSVAIRLCDEKTMIRLGGLAALGVRTGLLFAAKYAQGGASEQAMRKAEAELTEISEGMKDRQT